MIVWFFVGLVSNGPTENTTCEPGAQPHACVPDVPPPDQRIAVKLAARGWPTLTVSRISLLLAGVVALTDGVDGMPFDVNDDGLACGPSRSAPLVTVATYR